MFEANDVYNYCQFKRKPVFILCSSPCLSHRIFSFTHASFDTAVIRPDVVLNVTLADP